MEDYCKHLGINGMLSLMCCMFWIFSPAEGNTITEVAGSTVILNCTNNSNGTITQVTWKRNGALLISIIPHGRFHASEEAQRLNVNISESQQYALVIERVQTSHTGNYTCQIIKKEDTLEQTWELKITEAQQDSDHLVIAVAAIVPFVCCLVFILVLAILLGVRKRRAEDNSPNAEMEQEDIYENCLETEVRQQRGYHHSNHYKPRTH